MRKLIFFLCCPLLINVIGCSKENDPQQNKTTAVEVIVKDDAGDVQPGITVYLFDRPSSEEDGKVPSKALVNKVTDLNGTVTFNIEAISSLEPGQTIYVTVLVKSFTDDYDVAGSSELVFDNSEEVLRKDVIVVDKTPDYQSGFIPATISPNLVAEEYNRWKDLLVVPCNDGLRVVAEETNETKVEAIGFGMLLSAYANDRQTFDGLHKFYNSKRTAQAANMMAWDVTCDGITDPGSATDGDVDVAFALIVADKQWSGTYLDDAKAILQTIREHVIVQCDVDGEQVFVLGPGYSNIAWGGCEMMDIMYHTPAFFRVFAEVTGDDTWAQLADDTYVTLEAGAHPTTGLVPDWQTATGTPGPGGRADHFGYDACRAPWRITLDYLWNGNAQAEMWAKKVATWASSVGPQNIVDGYELDGTPIGSNGLNSAFLGGFSVATMAHSQATTDAFGAELSKLRDTYWFNLNTRCLYLFTLSGNFWDPRDKE